jgi:cysteine synthase A
LKVVENVTDLIGSTPMIRLVFGNISACLYGKLEYLNPGGSVKDRIAKQMIWSAERRGIIKPGDTIVEATSGNTGIGLSLVGAVMGYKVVIVMPETASPERRSMMRHYGAHVILTPSADFVEGALAKSRELAKRPGWWMPSQFENAENVAAHMKYTGREILEQIPSGQVDAFVAGIGTGGTLTGVGQALRQANPKVEIVAVEPVGPRSNAPKKVTKHLEIIDHQVEGIGDGFVPQIVNTDLIDDWVQVSDEDSIETACCLARERGLFVGISSGANVWASIEVAKRLDKGKNVVTILPDSADRYYTTGLFKASCCKGKMWDKPIID